MQAELAAAPHHARPKPQDVGWKNSKEAYAGEQDDVLAGTPNG